MSTTMIDPNLIPEEDFPLIVLSDYTSGVVEALIKIRTNASWNHVMMMIEPGKFASQGNLFSNAELSRYMRDNNRLKFWRIKDLTPIERALIIGRVQEKLSSPWWFRMYDYLGIFGQLTGLRFIHSPWKRYCSEIVRDFIMNIIYVPFWFPTPQDLDNIFKKNERMEVYGKWEGD